MRVAILIALAHAWALAATAAQPVETQRSGLQIVVIQGEDAVNIIQQKTAVAPVVEVRDRNNLPVPGAVVTFSVQGGKAAAFAGGAPTLTVTTNAAGQAVAAGLNPLVSGAVQINVQAAFQGQVAAATIAQTNLLTAAQAAAVGTGAASGGGTGAGAGGVGGGGGSGAGASAGGAAAGGGGGLSATTIGVIAAAAGAGAVAATQLGGEGDAGETYTGNFSGEMLMTFPNSTPGSSCNRREAYNGTLKITLSSSSDAAVSGTAELKQNGSVVSSTCTGGPQAGAALPMSGMEAPVSGSPSSLTFQYQRSGAIPPSPGDPAGLTVTEVFTFAGTLSGGEIAGTLTLATTFNDGSGRPPGTGSVTYSVVLR